MRLRKVKNALERLQSGKYNYFVLDPKANKGIWKDVFGNNNPIHIEIGCGKGQFITTLAKNNPDINYIAIEKFDSVLLRCMEKAEEGELIPNLKLAIIDASILIEYFASKEISRIYLNFSDPWPKSHHAKRRLTHKNFLDLYEDVLIEEGAIFFKTDNRHLFEFSLESFNECGWKMTNISLDLHKDLEKYPDNITTEFEDKWSPLGPIYRLEAYKK